MDQSDNYTKVKLSESVIFFVIEVTNQSIGEGLLTEAEIAQNSPPITDRQQPQESCNPELTQCPPQ